MTNKKKKNEIADNLKRVDEPPCKYYISTGSTLLDLAVSGRYPGGIGSGRITQIYGDNSTAKKALVCEILGAAQRMGGHAIMEDAETTLDFGWITKCFGLDTGPWRDDATREEHLDDDLKKAVKVFDKFTYRQPTSVSQLFDDEVGEVIKLKDLNKPVVIGVDTMSAIPSEVELKDKLDDATYGVSRAKMYSSAYRKFVKPMANTDLTMIAIDQTREKLNASWGKKHTISGGKAIGYYASTRILLKHEKNLKNKHDQIIGIKIKFTIEKNKLAPPMREGIIRVIWDYGIDDVTANLEWLADTFKIAEELGEGSPFSQSGSWWSWGDIKVQGLDTLVLKIEESAQEREVEREVARVWSALHKPSDRKRKER